MIELGQIDRLDLGLPGAAFARDCPADAIIEVENLTAGYVRDGEETVLLQDVSFDVLRVDFKPRYYAPFWVLMAIAVIPASSCVPAAWFARRRMAAAARAAAALVIATTMVWEQYGSVDENRASACLAGGTLCVPQMLVYDTSGVGSMRDRVRATDTVLCGDACTIVDRRDLRDTDARNDSRGA